eukprot:COSAG02_NODE_2621_length_8402_cov_12.631218_8_plen_309_part_00
MITELTAGAITLPQKKTVVDLKKAIIFYWLNCFNSNRVPASITKDGVTWKDINHKDIDTDAPGEIMMPCGCMMNKATADKRALAADASDNLACPCGGQFAGSLYKVLQIHCPEQLATVADVDPEVMCSICLGLLQLGVSICENNHKACFFCTKQWLEYNNSCPVGRTCALKNIDVDLFTTQKAVRTIQAAFRSRPTQEPEPLTAAESLPPFVLKEEYDGSRKDTISANTFEGYGLDDALENCPKQYVVLQLNRGDRINGRGLDMNMTMKNFPDESPGGSDLNTIMQRVWCETAKVINLQDGRLSCVYA